MALSLKCLRRNPVVALDTAYLSESPVEPPYTLRRCVPERSKFGLACPIACGPFASIDFASIGEVGASFRCGCRESVERGGEVRLLPLTRVSRSIMHRQ